MSVFDHLNSKYPMTEKKVVQMSSYGYNRPNKLIMIVFCFGLQAPWVIQPIKGGEA